MVMNNFFSVILIIICLYSLDVSSDTEDGKPDMKRAIEFMAEKDKGLNKLATAATHAHWNWSVNITKDNLKMKKKASKAVVEYSKKLHAEAKKFPWKSFREKNSTLHRWFQLVVKGMGIGASPDEKFLLPKMAQKGRKQSKNTKQQQNMKQQKNRKQEEDEEKDEGKDEENDEDHYAKMMEIFGKVKICPPGKSGGKCDTDVSAVFGSSRDPKTLKHYWLEFRKQSGEKYKNIFLKAIKKENKDIKAFGYKNQALHNIAIYEDKDFVKNVADEMRKIQPLYKQIHAYVRKKLREFYKSEKIQKDGPIPAHLLGDNYAQRWSPISNLVKPYPKSSGVPNVTKAMLEKKMKPIDMFIMAEKFFVSIGMKRMTPYFWHYSMITKPVGRSVDCHASATTFSNKKDYRIKMCTKVTAGVLETVHHEMGHIEYYMYYSHLPYLFQGSANPGFHEACGDAISLSVQTPSYLRQVGLLKRNETEVSNESTINYLMTLALRYVVTAPYAYIIDFWRNQVYEGKIKESELNKKYWKYRLEYQGVCPPAKRTEKHFDIGAKYHIASGVEYFRYYVANIMQFKIHKILCKEAGHKGPLHLCNIYKNKKAGKAFAKLLSAGRSKNWKLLLRSFSKGAYSKLDASPMLEYFKPLMAWLKKKNANELKGWKSADPMSCPSSSGATGPGTKGTTFPDGEDDDISGTTGSDGIGDGTKDTTSSRGIDDGTIGTMGPDDERFWYEM